MLPSFLESLLGRQPQPLLQGQGAGFIPNDPTSVFGAAPQSAATSTSPEAAPEAQPINVTGNPMPPLPDSLFREGLIHKGAFSLGHTGGNILGILGDALLAQGGHGPVYAPRLKRAQEAEALQDFTRDPEEASRRLMTVDPAAGAKLWLDTQTNQDTRKKLDAYLQNAEDKHYDNVSNRAIALVGAATKQSWPAIKQMYRQTYEDAGYDAPFDLPDEYDPDEIRSILMGGVDPRYQVQLGQQRDHYQAQESQAAANEAGRAARSAASISASNMRNSRTIGAANARSAANRSAAKERTQMRIDAAAKKKARSIALPNGKVITLN